MKVVVGNQYSTNKLNNNGMKNPSFNATGAVIANIMQCVESKGYFASFLIQDTMGMTVPRTITGFFRDKKSSGSYDNQEGKEVFLREALTGPYMMAVAPLVLFITTKFCRSTNTNTNLIKRYGESLKRFVNDSSLDNSIKNDAKKFKNKFIEDNISNIYKNSVPEDVNSEETIIKILGELKKLDNADKKTKDAIYKSISDIINNRIIETSVNLDNLNKVTVQNRQFNTVEVIKALDDFSNDAIINNLYFDKIDSKAAENIKNNFATKRLLTNIANIVLTLVGLSYIPKLYASSDISSSAKKLMQAQKQTQNDNEEQISFKGSKNINNNGIFSAIGKILTKYIPEKFNEMMEYVGYNFTKTTFIALSFFGLLAPRMKRAYERAQVMLNGKKDMTEINEILLRDTVASLTVVFAVPILTKMFVNHFEQKSGFVLTNRASKDKSPLKKFLDVINPYSKLDVLSIKDLEALYAKVDSKNKLINFANFINNKGGDLYAIISKSDNVHEVFNENSCKLDSLKNLALKERNEKIISIFKNIKASDIQVENEIVSRLMKSSGKIVDNKIFQFAKNYNSIPAFVSTFLISPLLLGVIIPSITYRNTRKAHEKMVLVSK